MIPWSARAAARSVLARSIVSSSRLRDERGGGGRLVLPVRRERLHALVVARSAVDARLDQNQPEFGVLVLAELVQVLAHLHGLLDQTVEVFRDLRSHAMFLKHAQDL